MRVKSLPLDVKPRSLYKDRPSETVSQSISNPFRRGEISAVEITLTAGFALHKPMYSQQVLHQAIFEKTMLCELGMLPAESCTLTKSQTQSESQSSTIPKTLAKGPTVDWSRPARNAPIPIRSAHNQKHVVRNRNERIRTLLPIYPLSLCTRKVL